MSLDFEFRIAIADGDRDPSASWHRDYADTAFVYIGGLSFDLSEGDIVAIFSQFGEPVFINLVRDKDTGKSKGFAFLKYEDQRSTDLAVDNLGGATLMGRTLRVDHTRYKKKDDEEIFDNTHGDAGEEEYDDRKKDDDASDDAKHTREILPEERELAELLKNHDDDDPMKEFLVQQKREAVSTALARQASQKPKAAREHRHRHRSGRNGHGHESVHRHRSRHADEKDGHRRSHGGEGYERERRGGGEGRDNVRHHRDDERSRERHRVRRDRSSPEAAPARQQYARSRSP